LYNGGKILPLDSPLGTRVLYYNVNKFSMTEEQEWASLLAEVFDKLTAKHAAISYKFDKLELSGMVDRNGKKVSTGTVVLTGGLTITTKT